MRECKYCQIKCNDNDVNCPLCGAHTDVVELSNPITPAEYPENIYKKSKRPLVKKLLLSTIIIAIAGMFIASLLSKIWAIFIIGIAATSYVWLGILQYVFNKHSTREIIAGVFSWIIFYVNAICAHFYFNGINGVDNAINALNISVGLITPILLAIINVIYFLIVMLRGNWYRYAYQTIRLSLLEIGIFFVNYLCDFTMVASIVCSVLGIVTILLSLVFGRNVLFAEFKKRFHM